MSRLEEQTPRCDNATIGCLYRGAKEADFIKIEHEETMSQSQSNNAGGKITCEVEILNKMGLHARPAMQFVDLANKYASQITVCKADQRVNAKSIMELLLLAATAGTKLMIEVDGVDAQAACDALVELVQSKFGEE